LELVYALLNPVFIVFFLLAAVHRTTHVVTDDSINDCIARWLRNSTDRKGGRKQRRIERAATVKDGQNGDNAADKETKDSTGSAEVLNSNSEGSPTRSASQ
jgi:hypothetical protein